MNLLPNLNHSYFFSLKKRKLSQERLQSVFPIKWMIGLYSQAENPILEIVSLNVQPIHSVPISGMKKFLTRLEESMKEY